MTSTFRRRLNAAACTVLLLVLAAAAIAVATRAEGTLVAMLMLASAVSTAMIVAVNRDTPTAAPRRSSQTLSAAPPFVAQRFARGERINSGLLVPADAPDQIKHDRDICA